MPDSGDAGSPRYRLITSLLDPQAAPAVELAKLYQQRWQIEAVFDEMKTHLRQGRRVLRSKTAELVRQEFYGSVLALYTVRWLLHEGAARSGQSDDALSFTGHVHLLRREQPRSGAFPPPQRPKKRERGFDEVLRASAASSCVRTLNQQRPRMVNRRNSSCVPHQRGKQKTGCDFTPVITAPTGRRPPPPPRLKLPNFIV